MSLVLCSKPEAPNTNCTIKVPAKVLNTVHVMSNVTIYIGTDSEDPILQCN